VIGKMIPLFQVLVMSSKHIFLTVCGEGLGFSVSIMSPIGPYIFDDGLPTFCL